MQIIRFDPKNPPLLPDNALTIGNFDGVHLGHQAMLATLQKCAHSHHLKTAVMVFEPQPREFFNPDNPPARLTNLSEKSALMRAFGLEFLLVASFNNKFRSLTAWEFAKLLQRLNVKHLILGDDFAFGHDRKGNKDFLHQMGFGVDGLPTISQHGERISSTAIRQALAQGDLVSAKRLLGRDYAITGEVVHGDKIGRQLGFPTANIALNRLRPAISGVFGADVFIYKDGQMIDFGQDNGIKGILPNSLLGAVNVGTRPSVHGQNYRLEVHLPDFTGDLYGATLQVVFTKYLHPEMTYPSLNALQAGIKQDVQELQAWLTSAHELTS